MKWAAVAASLLLMSFLSWRVFPGHTWLQQDSQIYVPILEHLDDPSVLHNDIVVERPHVAFTAYDELALGLKRVSGLSLHSILLGQQLVFRTVALLGVYLIAVSLGLEMAPALTVTLLWSLGATVNGPAVLTVEYEPVPRAFAVPLLMLAIGLGANGRWLASGIACAAAVLLHPPEVWPLLLVYACRRNSSIAFLPIALATAALLILAKMQVGVTEAQQFLAVLSPKLAALQRMRASYNWVDLWWRDYLLQYLLLAAVCGLAGRRLWTRMSPGLRLFASIVPVVSLLTMPASYLLLNVLHWALIPQIQPMRALLFVTAFASLLAASAGCVEAAERRYALAFAWFLLPCLLPIQTRFFAVPAPGQWAVWIGSAALCIAIGTSVRRVWLLPILYWAFASVVVLFPNLHSAELAALSSWARAATPKDAVFFFADNRRRNYPGAFRAEALRAVYVDWKGGGQLNYLPAFAEEWWRRWQAVQANRFDDLGIDYLVVNAGHQVDAKPAVFHNSKFQVYKLR